MRAPRQAQQKGVTRRVPVPATDRRIARGREALAMVARIALRELDSTRGFVIRGCSTEKIRRASSRKEDRRFNDCVLNQFHGAWHIGSFCPELRRQKRRRLPDFQSRCCGPLISAFPTQESGDFKRSRLQTRVCMSHGPLENVCPLPVANGAWERPLCPSGKESSLHRYRRSCCDLCRLPAVRQRALKCDGVNS